MSKKTFLFFTGILTLSLLFGIGEGIAQSYSLNINETGDGSGTVTSSPPGISCPGDCSETYRGGKRVTLRAKPSSDSYFLDWSGGGCSGTKNCTVIMNDNITVQATFQKKEPKISVSPDTLTFESVDAGKRVTEALTISNIGTADLHITISLTGANLSYSGRSSFTLKPTKNYTLRVTYHKPASDEDSILFSEIDSDEMSLDQKVALGNLKISSEAGDEDVPAVELEPLVLDFKLAVFHQFIVDFGGSTTDLYMTILMGQAECSLNMKDKKYGRADVSGSYKTDIVITGEEKDGECVFCTIQGGGKLSGEIVAPSYYDYPQEFFDLVILEKWGDLQITKYCFDQCENENKDPQPIQLPFTPREGFGFTISPQFPKVTIQLESPVPQIWGGWSWSLKK
jgi:hypothetical protein